MAGAVYNFPKRFIKTCTPVMQITDPEMFPEGMPILDQHHSQILLDFVAEFAHREELEKYAEVLERMTFCLPGEGKDWICESLNRLCNMAGDGHRW